MPRRLISSGSSFERDIGYSRAVVVGDRVFVAGATRFDDARLAITDAIVAQTEQRPPTIEAIIASA